MNRRCNYDADKVMQISLRVATELVQRQVLLRDVSQEQHDTFLATNVALDVHMDKLAGYSDLGLLRIWSRCQQLLRYSPFPIVCVHD